MMNFDENVDENIEFFFMKIDMIKTKDESMKIWFLKIGKWNVFR